MARIGRELEEIIVEPLEEPLEQPAKEPSEEPARETETPDREKTPT